MKKLARFLLNASLLIVAGGLVLTAPGRATAFPGGQDAGTGEPAAKAQPQTEDVLYHSDGRILHGQILEERDGQIVFEYLNKDVKVRIKMTFRLDELARVERDVPIEDAPAAAGATKSRPKPAAKADDSKADERPTFGVRRAAAATIPSVYLVPMKGQMGTDISVSVYKEMIDDIRAHKPDVLVMVMDSIDEEDRIYSRIEEFDKGQHSLNFLDMYQELVRLFHEDLGDFKQALWVHDSLGISSVVALSWENIYMKPTARLGGARVAGVHFEAVKGDADMYGKFREAYMALLKGFAEYGGNDVMLMDAMVRPEFRLSASWKGREVEWRLDDRGEYVVDNDEKGTVNFVAKTAEDFMVCDGIADSLDDIALLVGRREYKVIEGKGEAIFESHKEDWRRAAENCNEWVRDYQQFMGWANGEDALKFLGQAKGRLEKVVAAIDRYDAVKFRMAQMGVARFDLVTRIEMLKEQIRALREGGRGGGGGGGGRGGMGGGG